MEKWFRVSAEASSSSSMMPPPPPSPYDQATSNHQQQYCFQLNSLPADISNNNIPNYQLADDNHEYEVRMKSKIMAHPLFPRLMASYVNCQKVGAPPEVAARLEAAAASMLAANSSDVKVAAIDSDPELDQFMEAYCEMLAKYHQELAKPFQEAMFFLSSIDSQLKALSVSAPSYSDRSAASSSDVVAQSGSSEEAGDHVNRLRIDPQSEDMEIKAKLLVKYGQSLGSLRQEFIKKKKNGKLPKPARLKLQEWWSRHSRWPYPSESQKLALVESTGLGLKQINNWFINQRKRHWKPPTEDMQFSMMDAMVDHYQNYLDHRVCNPGFPMDFTSDPLI